jgi:hypothetical protein
LAGDHHNIAGCRVKVSSKKTFKKEMDPMPCRFEAKGSVAKRPAKPFAQPEPTQFLLIPRAADQKSVFERHLGSFAFLVPRWTVVVLIFKMKASFIF